MTRARRRDLADRLRPLSQLEHPREAIRQFTPNWFAATMGIHCREMLRRRVPAAQPRTHSRTCSGAGMPPACTTLPSSTTPGVDMTP